MTGTFTTSRKGNTTMNVSFVSLGCDKNRVNTEQMMALCLQAGITVQEDCPGSDVVVINTCGFIDSAKSEAIDTILSAAQLKEEGQIGKILVTGCLSQRYQADILEELPEIDGIMGTGCFGDIVPALEQVMEGRECRHFADINGPVEELPRVLSTPRHYAYLRIAEGCSNRCAYCVIPSLRGSYRSRRMEDILAEARALAEDGVRECIVIAQDITRYGVDLYGERRLPQLLRELCKLPFHWVRLRLSVPGQPVRRAHRHHRRGGEDLQLSGYSHPALQRRGAQGHAPPGDQGGAGGPVCPAAGPDPRRGAAHQPHHRPPL